MRLNISKTGVFLPSWNSNRELPENERIKVEYKRITGNLGGKMMVWNTDKTCIYDYALVVRECVNEIHNLTIVEDGVTVTYRTGESIMHLPAGHGLVTEIGVHIVLDSHFEDGEEKKNKDSIALEQRVADDVPRVSTEIVPSEA